MNQRANTRNQQATIDVREYQVVKLVAPTALKEVHSRRFFYAVDAKRTWKVEVAPDMRITCWCGDFWKRYQTGDGELCDHVQEALDLVDAVGFRGLPTWNKEVKPSKN